MPKNDHWKWLPDNSDNTAWAELQREFPEHRTLKSAVVYALPPALLDRIKFAAPDFLSPEEWNFERKLSRTGISGFLHRQPFTHPLLADPTIEPKLDAPIPRSATQGLTRVPGRTARKRNYFVSAARIQHEVDVRRRGFAGWLLMQPEFHRQLASLRSRCRNDLERVSLCGHTSEWLLNHCPNNAPDTERSLVLSYLQFSHSFGLESLIATHLPVPHDTEVVLSDTSGTNLFLGAGVLVFCPWYLVRDDTLAMRELIFSRASQAAPEVIRPWFHKAEEYGFVRYSTMFFLYVFGELTLRARYGKRIRGSTEKLDTAFASYIRAAGLRDGVTENARESIKRIRQKMRRLLPACRAAARAGAKQPELTVPMDLTTGLAAVTRLRRQAIASINR